MTERVLRRKVRHRLVAIPHAQKLIGNVVANCRYHGIRRHCYYQWRRRYEELGEEGLRENSSVHLSSPNQTSADVVGKNVYSRSHCHFGPRKMSMYLKRYPDVTISPSGIWLILNKPGMCRLSSSQH
jgi:transposase-like protein